MELIEWAFTVLSFISFYFFISKKASQPSFRIIGLILSIIISKFFDFVYFYLKFKNQNFLFWFDWQGVPCALFAHKEEVEKPAKSVGGYITTEKQSITQKKVEKKAQKIS